MVRRLRIFYLLILAPALAGFVFLAVNEQLALISVGSGREPAWLGIGLFIAAVATGVALPIWIRTMFAARSGSLPRIAPEAMLRFQHQLMGTALTAPYLALLAYGLRIDRFLSAATLLAALYAAYYFYPTRKRIDLDRRLFRVSA